MVYEEGDEITLNIGEEGCKYKYYYKIGKVYRGKRTLISMESDICELFCSGFLIGKYTELEIDNMIKSYEGIFIKKPEMDLFDFPNWIF